MILHIPHSSTNLLGTDSLQISHNELVEELYYMTDWYTDELFSFDGSTKVVFPYSRLVTDVERFNDSRETSNRGILYKTTLKNKPLNLYNDLDLYRVHHETLAFAINSYTSLFETVYLIDCHSFSPVVEGLKNANTDICIGFNDNLFNCPPTEVLLHVKQIFNDAGYTVAFNTPYQGSIIPDKYASCGNVKSIMIEVNKNLYISNEVQAYPSKTPGYHKIKQTINEVLVYIDSTEC